MIKKKDKNIEILTENVRYLIEDTTIYLMLNSNTISKEELNILYKKLTLIIEDNELSYINISGKNIEENKEYFQTLGFTLSYYDVNKLNYLYKGKKDKKQYKCYGIMTKKDFFDKIKEAPKEDVQENIKVISSNAGFINSMLLLFGGIILLCYYCVQGAIYLVK